MKLVRTRQARLAIALAGVLLVPVMLFSGPPAAAGWPRTAAPTLPLQGSIAATNTAWATVLMGKNDGAFDLFWQLFVFRSSTQHWALVTPPGVADNGGLIVSPNTTGTSLLVGFGASQDLRFSPLALTTTSGASWDPGGLASALVARPSAVAFADDGAALALVGPGDNQHVLTRVGGLTSWRTLETARQLEASTAGKRCRIGSIQAVAWQSNGVALIGATCRAPHVAGIFSLSGGKWRPVEVRIPTALARSSLAVLRLDGSAALLSAQRGGATEILAARPQENGGPWVLSAPLRVSRSADLLASGTGPNGAQFLLVRAGATLAGMVVSGSPASWRALPSLPKGTATLAFQPDGGIDALTVDAARLTVWRLGGNAPHWTASQSIKVPIQLGSSS